MATQEEIRALRSKVSAWEFKARWYDGPKSITLSTMELAILIQVDIEDLGREMWYERKTPRRERIESTLQDIRKLAVAIEQWAKDPKTDSECPACGAKTVLQQDGKREASSDADIRMLRALLERVARDPQSPPRLVSDIGEALEATAYAEAAAESEAVKP